MRVSKKLLVSAEIAAFLAGAIIFVHLVRTAGLQSLADLLGRSGLSAALVFLCYPFVCMWDVWSWKNLFPPEAARRIRFFPLFWIRAAGEAVNNVTPILDVGGEPLKARWAKERFGLTGAEAASATILAKTSLLIAEGFFVWAGLALGWQLLSESPAARPALLAAAAVTGAMILGIFLFQQTRFFQKWSPETTGFYTHAKKRFAGSAALNFAGWVAGTVELWVFSCVLGRPMSLPEAFAVESLVQLVRAASFFIPGNVGTQEAGYVYLAGLLGMDIATGMAMSLLKRARLLLWTGLGFVAWAIFRRRASYLSDRREYKV